MNESQKLRVVFYTMVSTSGTTTARPNEVRPNEVPAFSQAFSQGGPFLRGGLFSGAAFSQGERRVNVTTVGDHLEPKIGRDGAKFIDLIDGFRADAGLDLFDDNAEMTEAGHDLFARLLEEKLRALP